MEPWLVKLVLAALISAFTGIFGLFVWIVKRLFAMVQTGMNRAETNASKNLEMSRAILTELRSIRAHNMGLAGVVAGSIDGDVTPIQVPHEKTKKIKTQ